MIPKTQKDTQPTFKIERIPKNAHNFSEKTNTVSFIRLSQMNCNDFKKTE